MDWQSKTAMDLGREIAAGQVDPVELFEAVHDVAQHHQHSARIYTCLTPDRGRAEAEAARVRAQIGQRNSMLDGVPISWKDLFDTAGTATEAGSLLLKGRVPDEDARVLKNATAAGLVCLGKTHLSELAFSGLGYNPSTATPPNVNDAGAVPGGSSSGAAASVAFGTVPAAIGSDTGGSVRVPAVWNDLVGLKTTSGRLSLEGAVPLCLEFDTVGPLAKSVEDCAALMAVMEGGPMADLNGVSLEGVRFAALQTIVMDDIRDAPAAAYESALDRLSAAGARIEKIEVPELVGAYDPAKILGPLYPGEGYGLWRDVIEANPDAMYGEILERFRAGQSFSAPDYVAASAELRKIKAAWAAATAGYDAVLAPTAPILPPNLERLNTDSDYYKTENLMALRNTRVGNVMGLCALTLPTGVPSCGIMLMRGPHQEEALLRIGRAAETALS